MAVVARVWVAGELVNAAKMNTIPTDLTDLSTSLGTEIAGVSQTVTNAIAALGSASTHDVGTGDGNVPVLDSGGHLENARLSNIPTGSLKDDAVTQAKMANSAVGAPQLRIGTLNQSGNGEFTLPGSGLSFMPVPAGTATDTADRSLYLQQSFDSSTTQTNTNRFRSAKWRRNDGSFEGANAGSNIGSTIKYITSSDEPSLWVVLDASGVVVGMWEAEDPISAGDTVPPLSVPTDDQDVQLVGHTVVNVGVPPDAVISTLMATRQAALTTWLAYLTSRGWVTTSPATYSDTIDLVSDRYKPAARLWAMRKIAAADDIGEAAAYLTLLRVGSGNTWELVS